MKQAGEGCNVLGRIRVNSDSKYSICRLVCRSKQVHRTYENSVMKGPL